MTCHLRGEGGGLIVQRFPPPVAPRIVLENSAGHRRSYDLTLQEGEVAYYDEIVAEDLGEGAGACKEDPHHADE